MIHPDSSVVRTIRSSVSSLIIAIFGEHSPIPEDDQKSTEGKRPVLASSQFAACRTEYLNDYYWFFKPAGSIIDMLHYYLSVLSI